jgi:hypothetical protein
MIVRIFYSVALLCLSASAWLPSFSMSGMPKGGLMMASDDDDSVSQNERRKALGHFVGIAGFALWTSIPGPANALVKGVSPPPKKSVGDKPKCTNVEECQALAEQREQELREEVEQGPPPKVTASGLRYRDLEDGIGAVLKDGDDIQLYFKVLKLGKRSYDGLSGEGTVVFSRGKKRVKIGSQRKGRVAFIQTWEALTHHNECRLWF